MRASNAISGEGREAQALDRWSHHKKKARPQPQSPRVFASPVLEASKGGRAKSPPPPGRALTGKEFLAIIGHTMVPLPSPMGGRAMFGLTRLPGGAPKKA
ncbi:hypothetical protein CFAM422_010610 [Trichoderma lentiforme]|uniref:Uncharacterized protein n=1 Tax=Trichoderma lentiforme TaxID=1567552 RepID=A0A9P4X5Q0_9HYPO|nr:hypothetical protein CFAM422_010610 [Trichoderma lentiforme]